MHIFLLRVSRGGAEFQVFGCFFEFLIKQTSKTSKKDCMQIGIIMEMNEYNFQLGLIYTFLT